MSQVRPLPLVPRILCFEDALYETGWGLYYKFVVGFTALSLFTDGLAWLSLYFAVPLSSCDLGLYEHEVVGVHICFTIGKAIGGFVLCNISDSVGKKCMIPKSCVFIFISSFVSAFAHNGYLLYLSAFFLGSGIQANVLTTKIYLAEILPTDKRGFYMTLPDLFWTLGYLLTCGLAYIMTNSMTVEHQGLDMRLTSWRIIFALAGGLSITIACTSALLEIGPRYLLYKKRLVTAALVLKQFYAINKSKYCETFDLHAHHLHNLISDYQITGEFEPSFSPQQLKMLMKIMFQMIGVLLKRKFVGRLIIIILLKIPGFLGLVGVNIFLSRQLDVQNNTFIKGSDFVNITHINPEKNCNVHLDITTYENFSLLSINIFFGQFLLLFTVDRFGRKFSLFSGLILCGIASFVLAYSENILTTVIFSSIFTTFYSLIDSTLNIMVIESFPTAVRGTASAQACCYTFILSCFLYKFLYMPTRDFMIVLGSSFFGAAVLSSFIQESGGRPMAE